MTPARFRTVLADLEPLGLSRRHLARMWGYKSENSVRQWLTGRTAVRPDVAAWLERLHAAYARTKQHARAAIIRTCPT